MVYRHVWVDFSAQPPGKDGAQQDDLQALTAAWCSKRMSNLDYLLHLNRLAGRRLGDRTFHPFLPWSAAPPSPSPLPPQPLPLSAPPPRSFPRTAQLHLHTFVADMVVLPHALTLQLKAQLQCFTHTAFTQ